MDRGQLDADGVYSPCFILGTHDPASSPRAVGTAHAPWDWHDDLLVPWVAFVLNLAGVSFGLSKGHVADSVNNASTKCSVCVR